MDFIYINTLKVLGCLVISGIYFVYQRIVNLECEIQELKEMIYEHENFMYKIKKYENL